MKKLFCFFTCLALSVVAMAQTAEEILGKMEKVINQNEHDGLGMTVETKIPILGKYSMKVCTRGDKSYMETTMMGTTLLVWDDSETEWTYNSKNNELEITNSSLSSSAEEGSAEMFKGVADGYDVSIKKETAEAWYIKCKKSKSNPNKDDPKSMEIVVAKGTYHPISLSATVEGVTLTLKDLTFDVTEEQVTFDPKRFESAEVVDNREQQ